MAVTGTEAKPVLTWTAETAEWWINLLNMTNISSVEEESDIAPAEVSEVVLLKALDIVGLSWLTWLFTVVQVEDGASGEADWGGGPHWFTLLGLLVLEGGSDWVLNLRFKRNNLFCHGCGTGTTGTSSLSLQGFSPSPHVWFRLGEGWPTCSWGNPLGVGVSVSVSVSVSVAAALYIKRSHLRWSGGFQGIFHLRFPGCILRGETSRPSSIVVSGISEPTSGVCPGFLLRNGLETAARPLRLYKTASSDGTTADWSLMLFIQKVLFLWWSSLWLYLVMLWIQLIQVLESVFEFYALSL